MKENELIDNTEKKERAIAISVAKKGSDRELSMEHLEELEFLADTAGAEIVEKFYQELESFNPSTMVGKGKLGEIKEAIEAENITIVIFDDDLNPVQARNLENELKVKVLDRSGLILDIFVKRAKTLEAKTQVELAQLQYMLPRLTRMWTHLSKQFGGIGTKGPGETQIESDRRIIKTRIQKLREKLLDIDTQKEQQRKGREALPQFALVGYTNAGKSTLMNALTDADVYVEDKLFATLDTTVRSFYLPNGKKSLLSDTVGFIRKLPTHLIASFRSTLTEAREADILLHVVDISNPSFREHIINVNETLEFLKLSEKETIIVFNKIDVYDDYYEFRRLEEDYPNCIFISAGRGINIQSLLMMMQEAYENQSQVFTILLPYSEMKLANTLYSMADILERTDKDEHSEIKLRIVPENHNYFMNVFSDFIIG
jgi:GTP-binding protein HflX